MDKVAIILLAFNKLDYTKHCIESIFKNTSRDSFSLVLINNASSDGTSEYFHKLATDNDNIYVINNQTNLGFGEAANQGMQKAISDNFKYVCLLNNDTEVSFGWLDSLMKTMLNYPGSGMVQPTIHDFDGRLLESGHVADLESPQGNGIRGADSREDGIKERLYLNGSCILIKTDLLRNVGLFSSEFFPFYHEETDLCLRAHSQGWKLLFDKDSVIKHRVRGTSRDLPEDTNPIFWKHWNLILQKYHSYIRDVAIKGKTLFTLPGKIGDNFMRLPIAYQYAKQNNVKVDLCIDEKSVPMASLLQQQPWVNKIIISNGIDNYNLGGQPFDFGKTNEFKIYYEHVYNLGFNPSQAPIIGNLTLESLSGSKCPIDAHDILISPSIGFKQKPIKDLCIHLESSHAPRSIEAFEILRKSIDTLLAMFENIYIISSSEEYDYTEFTKYSKVKIFNDNGDMSKTVELLSGSILIGTYSSMWTLANCMKIKQVIIGNNWDSCCNNKKSYEDEMWVKSGSSDDLLKQVHDLLGNDTKFYGQFDPSVDSVLREYFPNYAYKGTMIDIGASDPIISNNSYHFENNGWDTYCIEANPDLYQNLLTQRKMVFNIAVSDKDSSGVDFEIVDLYIPWEGKHNQGACSSLKVDERLVEKHRELIHDRRTIKVNCSSMNTFMKENNIKNVDILSIDTEGTELDVLKGMDLNKHRPKVIVLENNYNSSEYVDYLSKFGYRLDKRIEVNDFYLRENV